MNIKPTVTLTEAEALELAQRVENMVEEALRKKAEGTTNYICMMTDIPAGMRAVVNALMRNYL